MNPKERSDFFRALSHDLRGSIGASAALLDMLYEKYVDVFDERAQKWIMLIREEHKKSAHKLKRLSQYSSLLSHEIKFEVINIDTVLEACFSELASESRINAKYTFSSKCSENLVSDEKCVAVVFSELFANSFAHSAVNKHDIASPIEIIIKHDAFENMHIITYADNGVSIEQKQIQNALKPFSIAASADPDMLNAGLGFSMIALAVEQLKGSFELIAEDPKYSGLCINIKLPK